MPYRRPKTEAEKKKAKAKRKPAKRKTAKAKRAPRRKAKPARAPYVHEPIDPELLLDITARAAVGNRGPEFAAWYGPDVKALLDEVDHLRYLLSAK